MKRKLHILPAAAGILAIGIVFSGCRQREREVRVDSLPEEVRPVAMAVMKDRPEDFARNVTYPIERPYPLHNINDSAAMVKYYPTLVDDSLKNVVRTTPDSLWREDGWQGWTLRDGQYFYIDGGKIYTVNYISYREKQLLDSLRRAEISTLDPSMRKGWTPVACVVDTASGSIFRIDSRLVGDSVDYRLAGYRKGTDLSSQPTIVLYGRMELDGSMGNRYYYFHDADGNKAEYSPDYQPEDSIPSLELDRHGKATYYNAIPDYWLNHVHVKGARPGDRSRRR